MFFKIISNIRSFLSSSLLSLLRLEKHGKLDFARGIIFLIISTIVQISLPFVMRYFIDNALGGKSISYLYIIICILTMLVILTPILSIARNYFLEKVSRRVSLDIKKKLFSHLECLPLSFFKNKESGYLTSRLFSDSEVVALTIGSFALSAQDMLAFFAGMIALLFLQWKLTLIVLVFLVVYSVFIFCNGKRFRGISRTVQEENARVFESVQESISGINLVKAFLREKYENQRISQRFMHLVELIFKRNILVAIWGNLAQITVGLAWVCTLGYGGFEVISGRFSIGGLIAFSTYLTFLFNPAQQLANFYSRVQTAVVSADRITEILKTQPEYDDGRLSLSNAGGEIEFKNVFFWYENEDINILNDVSFKIEPYTTVAIVGKSGEGKTSLVSLILRFYETKYGDIFIDGINIKDLTLHSLRSCIGLVSQDPFIFSTSIRKNILYGNPSASDNAVIQAAKLAQLHDYIVSLQDGYETVVGERGVCLSGGERQRLSIARLFLKNPSIIILDEATSTLDAESEYMLHDALESLKRGRKTIIIIAHRLSTIMRADRILVLDNGKIVGDGNSKTLQKNNDIYQKLFNAQICGNSSNSSADRVFMSKNYSQQL
ncbi:MAG: ABC transporter ATP-binding protein [Actinomycetota bacterium]|nr:ABC transporter ATP-binding protein [Actinomycetota bacterium]